MTPVTPVSGIFVNSDMGEAFGLHSFGNDEALMPLIDVANVACGFHSGEPETMDYTVALAKEHGVRVGALGEGGDRKQQGKGDERTHGGVSLCGGRPSGRGPRPPGCTGSRRHR